MYSINEYNHDIPSWAIWLVIIHMILFMTRVKTNTFYFINDFKFKHVSFDEVGNVLPFKGENPIVRDKPRKK